jgi:hypothetical protein
MTIKKSFKQIKTLNDFGFVMSDFGNTQPKSDITNPKSNTPQYNIRLLFNKKITRFLIS